MSGKYSNYNKDSEETLLKSLLNKEKWACKVFLTLHNRIFFEIMRTDAYSFDKEIERNIYKSLIFKLQKQNFGILRKFKFETSIDTYWSNICKDFLAYKNEEFTLISALKKGKNSAWKIFLERYGHIPHFYICKYANDFSEDDKKDIIQDFVCHVYEKLLGNFQFKSNFETYLSSCGYFFITHWISTRISKLKPGGKPLVRDIDTIADKRHDISVENKIVLEKLQQNLTFNNRVFATMKFVGQRSPEEICMMLGLKTRNAYDKRYFDIKAKLRKSLKNPGLYENKNTLTPREITPDYLTLFAERGIKGVTLNENEQEYFLQKGLFEIYKIWQKKNKIGINDYE